MLTKMIAEICYNHQGSIETAKKMIDECANLGLWSVKFQKWDIESFPPEIKNKKRDDKHAFGATNYEHRKFLEFNIEQLKELKEYAESKGLVFMCSAKDFNSTKLLVENGFKYIKLPSQRYLDNKMFNYLMDHKGLFILVSTGMHTENEILSSRWPAYAKVIMHCVSCYPVKDENADLGMIRKYPFYNGYSCHELTGNGVKYAVAMGCEYIERHFTLDKSMKGTDHKLSSDPEEMRNIINQIKEAELMTGMRRMTYEEKENMKYYRSF